MKHIRAQIEAGKVDIRGTRVFWNNDDIVRRHPDYYIGVNMVSARSQSNEVVGDGFSLCTDFFADGATFIHRDGLEYGNAKGAWDPAAIPGTTTRETELKPVLLWAGYRSMHDLAGGVADGTEGCAGFVYEKLSRKESPNPGLYGVRACKSYFFVEDAMLCLGAGIANRTPDVPGDIRTTIDQPEWRGPVEINTVRAGARTVGVGKPRKYRMEPDKMGDIRIEHNGIAYTILAEQTDGPVEFLAETARTHWVPRHGGNRGKDGLPKEVPLLRLAINHGGRPDGASYGYVVQPLGKGAVPARIVSNSASLQAVATPDGELVQAVFFSEDKTLTVGDLRLRVSSPSALMLRRRNGKAVLAVADLAQDPNRKEVVVRTTIPGAERIRIPMPGKPNCGMAAVITLALP